MSAPRPTCTDGGHVVGANEWLPANSYDYDWGASYPRIGCSNLRCAACGSRVRSFIGRELAPGAQAAAIFALVDWEHAAELVPSDSGRVYACACRVHQEFGATSLDPADPHPSLALPWRCATHDLLPLPGALDGVRIDTTIDFDRLAAQALARRVPHPPPWTTVNDRRHPGFWLARLYVLAPAPPYRTRIGQAAGWALDHADVLVRRGAINFFRFHPMAPGAEQLAHVLASARTRFDGVADPDDPRRDLGYYLREAIDLRMALRDDAGVPLDPPAHDAVRAELLAGRGSMELVLQIGDEDPQWLAQHGATIVGARPDLLNIVLRAFRRQPEAIAVSAVATIARAGAATPAALREGLAALSEPNRSAMLKVVDDT